MFGIGKTIPQPVLGNHSNFLLDITKASTEPEGKETNAAKYALRDELGCYLSFYSIL